MIKRTIQIILVCLLFIISGCTTIKVEKWKQRLTDRSNTAPISVSDRRVFQDIEHATRTNRISVAKLAKIFKFDLKDGYGQAHEKFISHSHLYETIVFQGAPIDKPDSNSFVVYLSSPSCIYSRQLISRYKLGSFGGPYGRYYDDSYIVNSKLVIFTYHYYFTEKQVNRNCAIKFTIYITVTDSPWASYEPPSLYPEPPYKGGG